MPRKTLFSCGKIFIIVIGALKSDLFLFFGKKSFLGALWTFRGLLEVPWDTRRTPQVFVRRKWFGTADLTKPDLFLTELMSNF